MNTHFLTKFAKSVGSSLTKHGPEILTGVGIAGMVSAAVMAVRVTPKALVLIEEEKREQNRLLLEEAKTEGRSECVRVEQLPVIDLFKTTWKCYLPAFITGTVSIICLVGANSVHSKRTAALATAYNLSATALSEYQEKVVETIGEKKEQAVRDSIAKDTLEKHPINNREIIITDKGNTLCYDSISGRYFRSDIDKIRRAANEMSRDLLDEMYIPLNDFYYAIGLPAIELGDLLGWNIDDGLIEVRFSSRLATDETPCLVLDYQISPRHNYAN